MKHFATHDIHEQALVPLMAPARRLAKILAPTPDQADDLLQDALTAVLAHLRRGGKIENLRPYLMTSLRNGGKRSARQTVELTDGNTPSIAPRAMGRLACAEVQSAIANLPDGQRSILNALVQHGSSYRELADRMNLPIGTVMSRIARARSRLRSEMGLPNGDVVEDLLCE